MFRGKGRTRYPEIGPTGSRSSLHSLASLDFQVSKKADALFRGWWTFMTETRRKDAASIQVIRSCSSGHGETKVLFESRLWRIMMSINVDTVEMVP